MQLALPVAVPTPEPAGPWADIGRWMVGEGPRPACLPIPVGSTREVVRPCGCQRRERRGAALWLSAGAGNTKLCAAHKRWPEAT